MPFAPGVAVARVLLQSELSGTPRLSTSGPQGGVIVIVGVTVSVGVLVGTVGVGVFVGTVEVGV